MHVPETLTLNSDQVIRLLKSLYELRQASCCWNKTIQDFLISRGLQQCQVDPGLYFIPSTVYYNYNSLVLYFPFPFFDFISFIHACISKNIVVVAVPIKLSSFLIILDLSKLVHH